MVATAPISAAEESVMGGSFFVSAEGKGGNQAVAAATLGAGVKDAMPFAYEVEIWVFPEGERNCYSTWYS